MARARKRPRPARAPKVAFRDGEHAVEALPMPLVSYPGHYGAFFAFASADAPERLVLCGCARPAVANYLQLRARSPARNAEHQYAELDSGAFPLALALQSRARGGALDWLEFAPAICHRCNMARPSMDYCDAMYGGQFVRAFGWYIRQAFFRFGVEPMPRWTGRSDAPVYLGHEHLREACPADLIALIEHDQVCAVALRQERDRIMRIVSGPARHDIAADEPTFYRNLKHAEAGDYVRLRRTAAQAARAVTRYVEDAVRTEFGFRAVGDGWVAETLLAQLVVRLLPDQTVIRHHRPDWLQGLELDVFVPGLKIGIEYQGQQHFHAIAAWGGAAALEQLQQRDEKKKVLCRDAGVRLLTVDYTEALTESSVRELLGLPAICAADALAP